METNYRKSLTQARNEYRDALRSYNAVDNNILLNGSTPRREEVKAKAFEILKYRKELLDIVIENINLVFDSNITIDNVDDVLQEDIA